MLGHPLVRAYYDIRTAMCELALEVPRTRADIHFLLSSKVLPCSFPPALPWNSPTVPSRVKGRLWNRTELGVLQVWGSFTEHRKMTPLLGVGEGRKTFVENTVGLKDGRQNLILGLGVLRPGQAQTYTHPYCTSPAALRPGLEN